MGIVTMDRFRDRLDAATYVGDPVVGVFESDPAEADSLWLSERLFARLTGVASAYELHLMPLLGGSEPVGLNRSQCEALLDEVDFVAQRLNDPLVIELAQTISNYVLLRTRRPGWAAVITIEGE